MVTHRAYDNDIRQLRRLHERNEQNIEVTIEIKADTRTTIEHSESDSVDVVGTIEQAENITVSIAIQSGWKLRLTGHGEAVVIDVK